MFQQTHEFILCAVNQVPPFDATLDWPHQIEGVKMENYVAWMKSTYWITATFCPAISVPAGFTPEGLPSASRSWAAIGMISACCRCPCIRAGNRVGRKRPRSHYVTPY